jgi:hypothetical protein
MQENKDILLELENSNDFLDDLLKIQELNLKNEAKNEINYYYEVIIEKKV